MTNPLIPYSFVPGTKAKAQEVNANFLALAEEITDNKTYFDQQVSSLSNTNSDTQTSLEETNSEVAKKLGYQNITNCIILAPNGAASYTGNTLTVKSGLKVLIPDGKNADGSLKNIEYTLKEDVSTDLTGLSAGAYYFYINSEGGIETSLVQGTFEQSENPVGYTNQTSNYLWLDKTENKYKYSTNKGTDWSEKSLCKLGRLTYSGKAITAISSFINVEMMKMDAFSEYTKLMMPDYTKPVTHKAGTFCRDTNGWLRVTSQRAGGHQSCSVTIDGSQAYCCVEDYGSNMWFENSFLPIPKGSSYTVRLDSGDMTCNYYPAKGG